MKAPQPDLYHRPTCPTVSPFGQLSFVRAYCDCVDHGGPVTKAELQRLQRDMEKNDGSTK